MATNIEKTFGGTYGLRLQVVTLNDETTAFIDYGAGLGSQRFNGPTAESDALSALEEFSEQRMNELTRDLGNIMKLRRYLKKREIVSAGY